METKQVQNAARIHRFELRRSTHYEPA
jgi:hypothetical protein